MPSNRCQVLPMLSGPSEGPRFEIRSSSTNGSSSNCQLFGFNRPHMSSSTPHNLCSSSSCPGPSVHCRYINAATVSAISTLVIKYLCSSSSTSNSFFPCPESTL